MTGWSDRPADEIVPRPSAYRSAENQLQWQTWLTQEQLVAKVEQAAQDLERSWRSLQAISHNWDTSPDGKYTYAIRAGAGGPVKIGTSNNPERRLRLLQSGNCEVLTLLGVLPMTEAEAHRRFADRHIRGEWFALTPHDLAAAGLANA